MTSAGGLVGAGEFRRQGQHPLRPGGRRGRLLARRAGGRLQRGHRLRHGGHEHRRLAVRRPVRIRVRNRKSRRADRRADAGDRNGRGRRRLDLRVRRREARRRPRQRRRRSRPGLLRPRRSAHGHRLQFLSRPDPARAFSVSARPRGGRGAAGGSRRQAVRTVSSRDATEDVPLQRRQLAEGFVRIANANMAQAIRSISIAKGYDPRDYVLVAFGGAGPQHACAVARELGHRQTCSVHPDAGVLSAYGIGLADVVRHRAAGVYRPTRPEA